MKTKTCLFVLLAGLSCSLLVADTLSYNITPETAGQTLYQFTLSNSGTTGGQLFDLFLALPTDLSNIETATIGKPLFWGDSSGGLLFFGPDSSPGNSFIEWSADTNGVRNLGVGNSLSGFSVTTLQPITGPIRFAVNGSTTLDLAVQGAVSSVPEPKTFGLLLSGAGVLAMLHRFRTLARGFHLSKAPHLESALKLRRQVEASRLP